MKVIHYIDNTTIVEHFHSKCFLQLFCHLMVLPSNDNNYRCLTIYHTKYLNKSKNGLDHFYLFHSFQHLSTSSSQFVGFEIFSNIINVSFRFSNSLCGYHQLMPPTSCSHV